jgi:hypothetical protein
MPEGDKEEQANYQHVNCQAWQHCATSLHLRDLAADDDVITAAAIAQNKKMPKWQVSLTKRLKKVVALCQALHTLGEDEHEALLSYLNSKGREVLYECMHNCLYNKVIPKESQQELWAKLSDKEKVVAVFKMSYSHRYVSFMPPSAAGSSGGSNGLYICILNNLDVNDNGKVTIRNDDKYMSGDQQPIMPGRQVDPSILSQGPNSDGAVQPDEQDLGYRLTTCGLASGQPHLQIGREGPMLLSVTDINGGGDMGRPTASSDYGSDSGPFQPPQPTTGMLPASPLGSEIASITDYGRHFSSPSSSP